MKTMYLWQEAPFTNRVNVYDNYVYTAQRRGDNTVFDFEEFVNPEFYFDFMLNILHVHYILLSHNFIL